MSSKVLGGVSLEALRDRGMLRRRWYQGNFLVPGCYLLANLHYTASARCWEGFHLLVSALGTHWKRNLFLLQCLFSALYWQTFSASWQKKKKYLKGPRSIFTKQSKRVNLELKGNKLRPSAKTDTLTQDQRANKKWLRQWAYKNVGLVRPALYIFPYKIESWTFCVKPPIF